MALTTRTRLGPYEILSALGAGGMGEVYKARDTRLDRIIAIKVLPETLAADPQFRERFEREARAISQLTHPHICTLYDIGRQDLTDFLVMEYLEGETLANRLVKGALPVDQALAIAIQIASALDTAHRAGIVHRDLKPGNIMLKAGAGAARHGTPQAKLLDFGLAKASAPAVAGAGLSMLPTTPPGLTAQGTILGTFQYMAPEQLEGQEADPRTDIFAFGAVLYEMLTGKKAFEAKTHASLIAAILDRDPPPISITQPLTPPGLDRIAKKCLAKDPETRWQTARDLTDELTWIAEAGAETVATGRSSRARLAWMVVAAASLLAAIVLAWPAALYFRRTTPEPVVTRLDVVTPSTTEAFSFALSLDGRQLVFAANGDKGSQLWLRPLDQATAQPLAGTEGAQYPFWSPDGRALGFFADAKLKRIDLSGGPPQVLADAPATRGGTWNRDGVIVFGPASTSPLMRVAAAGGTPSEVTRRAPGQVSHRWPQFLPDGYRFLFMNALGPPETWGMYIASLNGGEPTRVLAAETAAMFAPPGYLLLVSPEGTLVARHFDPARGVVSGDPIPVAQSVGKDSPLYRGGFSVSDAGVLAHRSGAANRRQLVWVDRSGTELGVLGPSEETGVAYPELAPDAGRVGVMRSVGGNSDVWLIEVGRGIASRFTFNAGADASPVWSPDGTRIIFRSSRNGKWDLFEKFVNGVTDEQPLLVSDQDKSPHDWSPDGHLLLYATQGPTTQSDLWAMPLVGDRKPFPVVQTSFDDVQGQFSPDGRWLAYASNESGRYEVYVRPFPDEGGKQPISTGGGIYPRWRRDGGEVFYLTLDNRVMAVPVKSAPQAHTFIPGKPVTLFASRIAIGANVGIGGFASSAQYAVAPDGRFLLNAIPTDSASSPITVVLNWTAALKK